MCGDFYEFYTYYNMDDLNKEQIEMSPDEQITLLAYIILLMLIVIILQLSENRRLQDIINDFEENKKNNKASKCMDV